MKFKTLSVFFIVLLLTGCGIKPEAVDPPASVTKDNFPHTYPDPSTDPK